MDGNALRTGKPSAETVSILHRYDLARLAARQPDEAVRQLHAKAVATGDRDLLFALAEVSYTAGEHIRRSVKPWDPRDARDFYLGSAVYAWLFLFGEGKDAPPGPFDRRFREACDLYNYSLGLALTGRRSTNVLVHLRDARRRLPVGEIELRLRGGEAASRLGDFEEVLLADQFRVHGLSVRNREPGVGAPLICVGPLNQEFGLRQSTPATAFLRGPASLAEIAAVSVGVAYGSDPRRVIQVLDEVAERHDMVEKEPKPQVLFTEFGDSTLTFELRYWIDVAKANAAQVSSDLRLMIAGSFAEHGIVIDFPQRDIHLHSARPIQVQVISPGNGRVEVAKATVKPKADDKPAGPP